MEKLPGTAETDLQLSKTRRFAVLNRVLTIGGMIAAGSLLVHALAVLDITTLVCGGFLFTVIILAKQI